MHKTRLTDEQVFQIYFLWKRENLSNSQIGKRLGINPGSVSSAKYYIKEYWQPKHSAKPYLRTQYKIGVQRIKLALMNEARQKKNSVIKHEHSAPSPEVTEQVTPEVRTETVDRFALLSTAFDQFQKSLETFIEAEVAERTTAVAKELKETQQKLKESEELLSKAEDAFDEARNSNWVDSLRKKWQKEAATR